MRARRTLVVAMLVLLGACKKETAATGNGPEWQRFEGVQYRVPTGTNVGLSNGSVLPGPGGLGGVPVGVRPYVTLSLAGAKGIYVQLTREPGPMTLDGMSDTYVANKIAKSPVGRTTTDGWELDYEMVDPTGRSAGPAHVIYYDLAGKSFTCTWANTNCGDPAAAEAVCRSVRVSTAAR